LPEKLRAIHEAGFGAIELGMSDLLAYGKELYGEATDVYDLDKIVKIAEVVKSIAGSLGLKILSLKPFGKFEGWKPGLSNKERDDAFTRARGWLEVMEAAGTDMLQVSKKAKKTLSSYNSIIANSKKALFFKCRGNYTLI
jgi:sugar phosphate isomerase/epimerase